MSEQPKTVDEIKAEIKRLEALQNQTKEELLKLLKKADHEWTFDGQNVIDDWEREKLGYVVDIMHNLPAIIEVLVMDDKVKEAVEWIHTNTPFSNHLHNLVYLYATTDRCKLLDLAKDLGRVEK